MTEGDRLPGNPRNTLNFGAAEAHRLRTAWAAAWLREYRCESRYIALLETDAAEELELRFAWLEWWDAACTCREALRRLETSQP